MMIVNDKEKYAAFSSTITPWLLRLSYFLYGSANACYNPFLPIWLASHSLTVSQIGIVATLNQLSIMLFVPILCLLVDFVSKNELRKVEILFCIFGYFSAASRIYFIFNDSFTYQFLIAISISMSFQQTVSTLLDSLTLRLIPNPNNYGKYRLFAGLSYAIIASSLGYIFDKYKYISIDYMFYFFAFFMTCLSFIWTLFLSCNCCMRSKTKSNHTRNINTYIDSAKTLTNVKHIKTDNSTSKLIINSPKQYEWEIEDTSEIEDDNLNNDSNHKNNENSGNKDLDNRSYKLLLFIKHLNSYKLLVIVAFYVMGAAYGVLKSFLFLWLQQLGASTILMGLTLVVTVGSEIPAFYFSNKVFEKIGELGVICIGLLAYMIRLGFYGCLGYWFLSNPWFVLFAEVLHGLTYAWIWSSIAIFAFKLVNDGDERLKQLSSFSQGFLSSVFSGFGQASGAFVGGIVFQHYGAHYLFFGAAACMIPFFFIFCIKYICCTR